MAGKEDYFMFMLIGAVFLILVFLVISGNNDKPKFSDITNIDGGQSYTVVSDSARNSLDITIKYTTPANPSSGALAGVAIYKWPIVYLIDITGMSTSLPTTSGVATGTQITTIENYFNGYAGTNIPSPKQLLLSDTTNVAVGAGTIANATYYQSASIATSGTPTFFPNMINLSNLLSSASATYNMTTDPAPVSDALSYSTSYTQTLSGVSQVVRAPLITGKSYVLGIAVQYATNYINAKGTAANAGADPLTRRFSKFNYKVITPALGATSITVSYPTVPAIDAAAPITLGTLTV